MTGLTQYGALLPVSHRGQLLSGPGATSGSSWLGGSRASSPPPLALPPILLVFWVLTVTNHLVLRLLWKTSLGLLAHAGRLKKIIK